MEEREYEFDCMFHLCGYQRLPTYWGMHQHKSRKHVLIATDDVDVSVYELFAHPFDLRVLRVDPYDAKSISEKLLDCVAALPDDSRLAFNLTAGSKMMYQAALEVAHATGGYAHYFTTGTYAEMDISASNCSEFKLVRPIAPIRSVETFLRLNTIGCKIANKGKWNDVAARQNGLRSRLRGYLRSKSSELRYLYKVINPYCRDGVDSFDVIDDKVTGIRVWLKPSGRAGVESADDRFEFREFPDIAKFICGGWLEEVVFLELQPLLSEGLIFDLRINTVVTFEDRGTRWGREELPYNEFDVLFTDGTRLYIVECKAGIPKPEYVVKLQNSVRNLGGMIGKGVLVCPFAPQKVAGKKLLDARECRYVSLDVLRGKIKAMVLADRKDQLMWSRREVAASREGYVRTVLVFRAVPGSGKTTFSNRIRDAVAGAGLSIAVHSTDAFFINPMTRTYDFDAAKLPQFHAKNLENFKRSLEAGVDLVAVDNTNLRPWETEPYTEAARKAGYRIVFFNFAPRELEKHLAAQQVTPDRPDAHQVPKEVLERFVGYFHQYDALFDHGAKPHPELVCFEWDETQKKAVPTDVPARPFDYDDKLDISPDDYHVLKDKIGGMMLNRFLSAKE